MNVPPVQLAGYVQQSNSIKLIWKKLQYYVKMPRYYSIILHFRNCNNVLFFPSVSLPTILTEYLPNNSITYSRCSITGWKVPN